MPSGVVVVSPGGVPGWCHVLPPSSERWMICPNQLLVCDAYRRSGLTEEALRWYISQPVKRGPLTSHCFRFPSDVRTNAPLRVPTSTRTVLIPYSFLSVTRFSRAPPAQYTTASGSAPALAHTDPDTASAKRRQPPAAVRDQHREEADHER